MSPCPAEAIPSPPDAVGRPSWSARALSSLRPVLVALTCLLTGASGVASAAAPPSATGLTSSSYTSCVVRPAGHVACWGPSGVRWTSGTPYPSPAGTPTTLAGIAGVTQVSVGASSACARVSSGKVLCWGTNTDGQLGDGTTTSRSTPAPVAGLTDATQVTVGTSYACARRATGTVACWGSNIAGELGNGTQTASTRPVKVKGLTDATQVSAAASGYWHVCARRSTGGVSCWGTNSYGVLGDGTGAINRLTPVAVKGLTDATQISVGFLDACARRAVGKVVCWGQGTAGQLGNGTTTTSSNVPVTAAGITDATQVSVGALQTICARRVTGAARCWGANEHGQIGDGTKTQRTKPVAVKNLADATEIAVDSYSSCALRASGAGVCWGDNAQGQLGDGTTTPHLTPYPVAPYPAE